MTVVRSLDDFLRAASIRSIVYMGGQNCPHAEEFDGNDFCAMHLIGWIAGEPAASLRLRFFAGFAKVERLAVRREYRRSDIAFAIVRRGLSLIARKGYRIAYGHARTGLEPFWARFGAQPLPHRETFSFSGQRYREMVVQLPPDALALSLNDDPMVLIRPEGDWDRPGILESGAAALPDATSAGAAQPDEDAAEIGNAVPPVPERGSGMPPGWLAWSPADKSAPARGEWPATPAAYLAAAQAALASTTGHLTRPAGALASGAGLA